MLRHTRRNRL